MGSVPVIRSVSPPANNTIHRNIIMPSLSKVMFRRGIRMFLLNISPLNRVRGDPDYEDYSLNILNSRRRP